MQRVVYHSLMKVSLLLYALLFPSSLVRPDNSLQLLFTSVAHNFGCLHDRGSHNKCDDEDYKFGWRDPAGSFRTVLAQNCRRGQCDKYEGKAVCPRVPRFSTPSLQYDGKALGDELNNNVRRLNEKRFEVCNFYTCGPISKPPTPSPTISHAPTMMQVLGGDCALSRNQLGSWAHFSIRTDKWGEETSWNLFDNGSKLIAHHDVRSYFDEHYHERYICVPPGPLSLTIKDLWGDGKC